MIVSCNFRIFNLGLSENVEKTKKKTQSPMDEGRLFP
jgi:hypothetical protein